MKKNFNIYSILIITFLFIAAVPILFLSNYMMYNNGKGYEEDFYKSVTNNLNRITKITTSYCNANENMLNILSSNPYIIDTLKTPSNEKPLQQAIDNLKEDYKYIENIIIATPNGKIYSTRNNNVPLNYDPRKQKWYIDAVNGIGQPSIFCLHKSQRYQGDSTLTYSKAILDKENGKLLGVTAVDIDLTLIKTLLYDNTFLNNDFSAILSDRGDIIASNNIYNNFKTLNDNDWINSILNSKNGTTNISLGKEDYICYSKKIENLPLTMVTFIPKKEINNKLIKAKALCLITILIIFSVVWIIAFIFANIITDPFTQLVQVLNKVGEGDYSSKVEPINFLPYELNLIINSVNNMIEKVSVQQIKLQQKNEEIMAQSEEITAQNEEITELYHETINMNEELKKNYKQTVASLINTIEANDEYTKGHCERVSKYAVAIASEMGFKEKDLYIIEFASLLHDIGKIGIPSNILRKNSKLTDEEFLIIKEHPSIGYNIVKDIAFLKDSAQVLYEHHERIDGKGYPQGLKGDEINVLSKILTVADCYDAMTSSRAYRTKPLNKKVAINELVINGNSQFDKNIVNAFIRVLQNNSFNIECC